MTSCVVGWITSGGYAHYSGLVAGMGLRPDRARRRIAGLRDRDHRQAPPGAHPEGAAGRPRRAPNAGLSERAIADGAARRRRPPGAAARRRRGLPRRARPGERVAAPDGEPARRERQRPRAPFRFEGRPDRRRPAPHRRRCSKDVEAQWLERRPDLSQADLLRAWWRWITASPQNLAVVRLGIEAAALDATVTGLPAAGARRPDRHLAVEHRAAPARRGCRRSRRRRSRRRWRRRCSPGSSSTCWRPATEHGSTKALELGLERLEQLDRQRA